MDFGRDAALEGRAVGRAADVSTIRTRVRRYFGPRSHRDSGAPPPVARQLCAVVVGAVVGGVLVALVTSRVLLGIMFAGLWGVSTAKRWRRR
jgi:hypothetical protein